MTTAPDVLAMRSADELCSVFDRLREASRPLAALPLTALLEPLARLRERWTPGTPTTKKPVLCSKASSAAAPSRPPCRA